MENRIVRLQSQASNSNGNASQHGNEEIPPPIAARPEKTKSIVSDD